MTQEEKLSELIKWLNDKKIEFEDADEEMKNVGIQIITKQSRIAVALSADEVIDEYTHMAAIGYHLRILFIRETDSAEFVVTKMRNMIRGHRCLDFDACGNLTIEAREKRRKLKASRRLKGEQKNIQRVRKTVRRKRRRIHIRVPRFEKVGEYNRMTQR